MNLNEPKMLLQELIEDFSISRNVKAKLEQVMIILEENEDVGVKCDKALQELTLLDDPNINSFIKTRIWSLMSILESITNEQ